VPVQIKSRHTANGILNEGGLPRRFEVTLDPVLRAKVDALTNTQNSPRHFWVEALA
jgi:hypothetical protein